MLAHDPHAAPAQRAQPQHAAVRAAEDDEREAGAVAPDGPGLRGAERDVRAAVPVEVAGGGDRVAHVEQPFPVTADREAAPAEAAQVDRGRVRLPEHDIRRRALRAPGADDHVGAPVPVDVTHPRDRVPGGRVAARAVDPEPGRREPLEIDGLGERLPNTTYTEPENARPRGP